MFYNIDEIKDYLKKDHKNAFSILVDESNKVECQRWLLDNGFEWSLGGRGLFYTDVNIKTYDLYWNDSREKFVIRYSRRYKVWKELSVHYKDIHHEYITKYMDKLFEDLV